MPTLVKRPTTNHAFSNSLSLFPTNKLQFSKQVERFNQGDLPVLRLVITSPLGEKSIYMYCQYYLGDSLICVPKQ